VCAWAAIATGNHALWQIGFVASFGSKLSDTVSSEVGKGYGKTTYLITTLARVPRGTEGAVSVEGTLAGVTAALAYALLALLVGQVRSEGCLRSDAADVGLELRAVSGRKCGSVQVDTLDAVICTVAATAANLFESYLGASVQDEVPWMSNDVVNMIQISVAAAIALGLKAGALGTA